jgi:transposase-like protein
MGTMTATLNDVAKKKADRMLGEGKDIADVCRELGVAEQTYYRGRNQFGGLKADDAKWLKDLERENATLKRPGTPAGGRGSPHPRDGCE